MPGISSSCRRGAKAKFPVDGSLVTVDRRSLSYEHTRVHKRNAQWFFVTRFSCCFSFVSPHVPLSSRNSWYSALTRSLLFSLYISLSLFLPFSFTAPTIKHELLTLHCEQPTETKGYFFVFGRFTRRASLPLVVYAAQGEPPFSYCADRPGLLSLLANRKRGFARQGKKQQRTK